MLWYCQADIQCPDQSGLSPSSVYTSALCTRLHGFDVVVKPVSGKAHFAKYKCNTEKNKTKNKKQKEVNAYMYAKHLSEATQCPESAEKSPCSPT